MADDEISIDLGKVTSFFKRKKKAEKESKEEKTEDEEISVDFGKIKNIFKKKEARETQKEGGDEIGVDLAGVGSFLNKNKVVLLLIIPIILCIFLRMQSDQLAFTDNWATNSVYTYYQNQITAQIDQQYPNLPAANKQELVSEQFNTFIKDNKDMVNGQIAQTSAYFKTAFQDESGRMYMPDIDPYYWYRYSKNIVDHGYAGDIQKDGMNWDTFQVAPNGRPVGNQDLFHPYFLTLLYNVIHPFTGMDLMRAIMYYPVIISALSIIPIFFIARRIGGNTAAFFAAMMAAANAAFLNRTLFGHADSDAWVFFFPVFATWFFLEAFESENPKKQVILSALSGLFVGLFSFVWGGWWYILDFVLATIAIYSVYYIVVHRKEIMREKFAAIKKDPHVREMILVTAAFVISSGIFVSLFTSPSNFFTTPLSSIGFTNIKAPVSTTLWPNVLTTVAELNPGSIDEIIGQVGGRLLFYIAVLGIILSVLRKDRHGRLDIKPAILLTLWFIATVYASTKGIRFTIILVPAFSIAFGVAIGKIYSYGSKWASKELHIHKIITGTVILLLLSMTLWAVPVGGGGACPWYLGNFPVFGSDKGELCAGYQTARQDVPIINDAWYNALTTIKNQTPQDTIITSWWDFGHHFKAIAERPVTFDGTTQDFPQAHWVGKFFMTDNEHLAMGILRMLDCGGEYATDVIIKEKNTDARIAVNTMYQILELDKPAARQKLLSMGYTGTQADAVLKYSHCGNPNGVVIASEDMIGKSGVWAHFGSWDFDKAAVWQNTRNLNRQDAIDYMTSQLGYTEEKAEQTYYEVQSITTDQEANNWVAPWPGYSGTDSCSKQGSTLACGNGLNVDLGTMDAWFESASEKLHPVSIVYATPTDVVEKKYNQSIIPQQLSIILIPTGTDSYTSIASSLELANSMFTKLYFFEGHGLSHYNLLTHEQGITGTNVYVWTIDWEGSTKNILPVFKPKETVEKGFKATVNYIGYFENNTVFDSSIRNWAANNVTKDSSFESQQLLYSPITFTTGTGELIQGFDEAVTGMRINETKTVKIPPEKAYGTDPSQFLGNQTLYFKIKVVGIE